MSDYTGPRTDAGRRAMLDSQLFRTQDGWESLRRHVLAIEDESRRLLARRAPGDRGLREALERLEGAGRAFVDFNPGQIARASFWDALELARRALAADSRPEQPAPLDVDDGYVDEAGHTDACIDQMYADAGIGAVRPEEPPE